MAGLERARKGCVGGRQRVVTDRARVADLRAAGKSLGDIAADMGLAKWRGSPRKRRPKPSLSIWNGAKNAENSTAPVINGRLARYGTIFVGDKFCPLMDCEECKILESTYRQALDAAATAKARLHDSDLHTWEPRSADYEAAEEAKATALLKWWNHRETHRLKLLT